MDHEGDWIEQEQQLINVVASSGIGRAMFSFAIDHILGSMVQHAADDAIQKLLKKKQIMKAEYQTALKDALKLIQSKPGMDHLPDKRIIDISYRKVAFHIRVNSVLEELECRFGSALKEVAVLCGDLEPLMCEDDLVEKLPAMPTGRIDTVMVLPWKVNREALNKQLRSQSKTSGASIVDHLQKKESNIKSNDTSGAVEIRFFEAMVGSSGEAILAKKVMNTMPTQTAPTTEKQVLKELEKLEISDLFRFTGSDAQGVVTSVNRMVQDLIEGRGPSFPKNPDDFHIKINQSMAFFCRSKIGDKNLVGREAVEQTWQHVNAMPVATIDDLEIPVKFAWLLAPGEQLMVEAKRKEAIKTATATLSAVANPNQMSGGKSSAAASKSSSSSSSLVSTAASPAARGKHTISEREDAAVMCMFKKLKSM